MRALTRTQGLGRIVARAGIGLAVDASMGSQKFGLTLSLVPLLLSAADVAAQPIFEFPIGASAGGDGSAERDALVESVGFFDPPIVRARNRRDSLLARNPITASDQLFAAAQRGELANAQVAAFCGVESTARSQVEATDDWQIIGKQVLISFTSRSQADHRIAGYGPCVESLKHTNSHLGFDEVEAPFEVSGGAPEATLVVTATLSANETTTPGPLVLATGSIAGTWEIWNDANRNHVIDADDRRIAVHNMTGTLGDTIGPFTFHVPVSTHGAFVARFRARTRTSMMYRPPAGAVFNPVFQVGTAFSAEITIK